MDLIVGPAEKDLGLDVGIPNPSVSLPKSNKVAGAKKRKRASLANVKG